jgi:predicted Rossmann fold nucleotide-binding protein DprA/Smf involved in DNA uptake
LHLANKYQTGHFALLLVFLIYKILAVKIRNNPSHAFGDVRRIDKTDPEYPNSLIHFLANDAPDSLTALGNLAILDQRKSAIFCSARCPAGILSQARDLMEKLADPRVAVIGGFHSPVERECLNILLSEARPIILCPARSLVKLRVRREHKGPLEEGRLLYLSFFRSHRHRSDVEMASRRNRCVAAIADNVLIVHAAPSSKTEQLCRDIINWQKAVYTIDNEANEKLVSLGAHRLTAEAVSKLLPY